MDVEMYKKMDEIMGIMHQIATYLSEFATAEMNGKQITKRQIDNNKILETLFIRVQKAYRELQKLILEDTESINSPNGIEDDIDENIITGLLDIQKPESIIYNTISDLEDYLEMSYSELRYISLNDGNGKEFAPSIYKNTKFEALRNSEYNLQCSNLECLLIRNNIKNPIGAFSFKENGNILSHMAQCEFYDDYAFKQINRYISDLSKESTDMNKKTYEELRDKLIEQKYILYFAYLNNKYNGMIQENDIGKLGIVKKYLDEDLESLILNMTKFDIEENIKVSLQEYKREFKEVIKDILEKENITSRKEKIKKDNIKKSGEKDIPNTAKAECKDEVQIEDKFDSER